MHQNIGFKGMTLSDADGYIRSQAELEGDTQTFSLEVLSDSRAKVVGYGRGQGGSAYFKIDGEGRSVVRYSGLEFVKEP